MEVSKALYGLKHSPNLCYKHFMRTLIRLALIQEPEVNCLFTNKWLTVLFYDIVTIYHLKNRSRFEKFEKELLSSYDIRALGYIKNFFKIRVTRDRSERKLWLTLDAFSERVAQKYYILLDFRPPYTPLPSGIDLSLFIGQANKSQIQSYQQKVGNVNYAAIITQPDITRAALKLSEFLRIPSLAHTNAINHLFKYLICKTSVLHLALTIISYPSSASIIAYIVCLLI